MMDDPDEVTEEKRLQIEDMVKGLIQAFPDTKYVALNAMIGTLNAQTWKSEWYAVGFEEAPFLKELDGYLAWVKNDDVTDAGEEEANFFAHFSSNGWFYKDQRLQTSVNEFMNEEDLCFYVGEDGEVKQFKDPSHFIETEESMTSQMNQ